MHASTNLQSLHISHWSVPHQCSLLSVFIILVVTLIIVVSFNLVMLLVDFLSFIHCPVLFDQTICYFVSVFTTFVTPQTITVSALFQSCTLFVFFFFLSWFSAHCFHWFALCLVHASLNLWLVNASTADDGFFEYCSFPMCAIVLDWSPIAWMCMRQKIHHSTLSDSLPTVNGTFTLVQRCRFTPVAC